MGKGCLVSLGVVGALLLAGLFVFFSFKGAQNQLVQKDEAVKNAWSNVDADLQRRADLIPNLVETVKGYAKQETTVFGDIANARAGLLNAHTPQDKIAANNTLDGAFGRLLALTENYPQLKSNEQFMRLQDEIAGTENRIKVSRTRYNTVLRDYNTYVRSFPNSIWAGMLGFQAHEDAYFEANAASRNAPQVKF
ncbi:LemA family protein [Terracidiphilus sp.]|jgi:LemA protein|uniref:LemA family protein n=1 Tax=Terracidiphilus sp. TaxID=1964191 RepID=UPI003C23BC7E